jgi:hypothetical protein
VRWSGSVIFETHASSDADPMNDVKSILLPFSWIRVFLESLLVTKAFELGTWPTAK